MDTAVYTVIPRGARPTITSPESYLPNIIDYMQSDWAATDCCEGGTQYIYLHVTANEKEKKSAIWRLIDPPTKDKANGGRSVTSE